jgi:pyruvate,water dikinase
LPSPGQKKAKVVELGSKESLDFSLCGAKAASLARLKRAGFAVPPGFVITTEAIIPGPLPAADVERACRKLPFLKAKAAVRSSATAEDLPEASFAGQYDTILNVASLEELLAAAGKCRDSLTSERARSYLSRNGIPPEKVRMAVLVQEMVPAEVSGVIFTANPQNGLRHQMLVNVVRGIGEPLASGRTDPEQLVLEKDNRAAHVRSRLLDETRVRELVKEACLIEKLFGFPQDIEFAFSSGRLHILQARPVTALPGPSLPFAVSWGDPANKELAERQTVFWCNWNTRENMAYPLKPMAWSFFNDILVPQIMKVLYGVVPGSLLERHCHFIDLVEGRAYWNMTLLAGNSFSRGTVMKLLDKLDMEAYTAFGDLAAEGAFRPARLPIRWWQMALPMLRNAANFLTFPWLAPPGWIERRCRVFLKQAEEYVNLDLKVLSMAGMFDQVRRYGYIIARFAFPLLMVSSKSLIGFAIIEKLIGRWPDVRGDGLLAGLPGNKTTETALELYRLSLAPAGVRRVFAEATIDGPDGVWEVDGLLGMTEAGREFLDKIRAFLAEYGHRGMKDLDVGHPSWAEDPTYVYRMIRSYMSLGPDDPSPLAQFEKAAARRKALEAEIERRLSATLLDKVFPVRRRLFRLALGLVHDFFPWRENEKFYGIKVFPGSRRIIREAGRRYATAGLLESEDDIFFMTVPEVERQEAGRGMPPAALRETVARRRREWEGQVKRAPPFIVRSDGIPWRPAKEAETPGVLRGVPASPGRATGPARIIREPAEAHLFRKGEILVAPYTEPGWAPLFLLARALVMEVGGAVCHGAIVAREYGIPAVVGAKGALAAIKDGQTITVDGSKGEVILEPGMPSNTLQGGRNYLKPPRLEDLEYIRALWADPKTMEAVGGPVVLDEEKARKWFERMVDPGSPHDRYYLICDCKGSPVGEASFHRYDPAAKTAELNIKIEAKHRYRGHGPEALKLLLDYFFGEFGGEVMLDPVRPENRNGRRALIRAGFEQDRSRSDVCLLRLTRERFQRLKTLPEP